MNGVAFGILSFLLLLNVIPMFLSLNELQKRQMQLTSGVKMLTTIFGVFTICYISRTLYDCIVSPTLGFAQLFSGLFLPLFWDFMPIYMMFNYHYKHLK